MKLPRLQNRAAQRIFMDRHVLLETPKDAANGDALLKLIARLGFVQLDSINTVARAHDLILFARRPSYRPENLKHLYEREQALFEHWTDDAAMIPRQLYRQCHLRRSRSDREHRCLTDRFIVSTTLGLANKLRPALQSQE